MAGVMDGCTQAIYGPDEPLRSTRRQPMKRLRQCRLALVILTALLALLLGERAGLAINNALFPIARLQPRDSFAQARGKWIKMPGPTGGEITALLASGGHLYAGASSGSVFVSVDQGRSWREFRAGLPAMEINSLAASGTNLYAGTERGGVYRSADRGRTWAAVNAGLPPEAVVRSLAVNDTSLFAGIGDYPGGVYRSTDQGQHWMAVNAGLPTRNAAFPISETYGNARGERVNVTALFVSGADIFAGTQQDGLFRSTDRGLSWIKTNLPESIVFSFAADDRNIFVGLFDGIYRSTDQGRSWTKADAGLPPEVNARAQIGR